MPSRRAQVASTAVGSILVPVAGVAFLLAVGYRLDGPVVVLLASLATLGGGVALAGSRGVVVAPVASLTTGAVLALDPMFGAPPPASLGQFSADALFLAVCHGLLATAEWMLRNRAVVASRLSERDRRAAVAGGVAGVCWLFLVQSVTGWPRADPLFVVASVAWMLLGAALLGATAALGWTRRRLATPGLVVGLVALGGVVDAGGSVASSDASVTPSLLTLASVGWFVPLAVALGVGAVELHLRQSALTDRPTD